MSSSSLSTHRRALGLGLPEEARLGPVLALGNVSFDARLGGLPRGRITEFLGGASVGKTALMLQALANTIGMGDTISRSGGLAALIDLSGTIFPEPAWAERKLLVVRPRCAEDALRALDALLSSAAFDLLAFETSGLVAPLPEVVTVRVARLARETGSAVIACGISSIFGSSCSLRVQLTTLRDGSSRGLVTKSKQGGLGEEIVLSAPSRNSGGGGVSVPLPVPTPRRVA